MDALDVKTFSEDVRSRVSPKTREIMDQIAEMTGHAHGTVAKFDHVFELTPKGDLRHLHNQYADALFASLLLRNAILNRSIVEAVNRYDFLTYALAGRSLIEIAATARYYVRKKITPIVHKVVAAKQITNEQLRELIEHEDRFLRGSRFDWDVFFTKGFEALATDYSEWIKRKQKHGSKAKRWEANPLACEQINTATCLEAWALDDPRIGVLYDLFCEMVHPNIGSMLCIASLHERGIQFAVNQRGAFGLQLFDLSYGPLQVYVAKEFVQQTYVIIHLKFQSDELE